jgi:hypothetical protein
MARDQLLKFGHQAFETKNITKKEQHLAMKRKKSQSVINRNKKLLEQIRETKTDHPLWGYRRIWSYLKYRQRIAVNVFTGL